LPDEDKAFESYRRGVSKQIPKATRIAWSLKKDEIQADSIGITKQKFLYNLSRASYEKNWGKKYQKPTFGEQFLGFLWKLLPKIGPLKVLEFRTPTPETEHMFEQSFNVTLDRYRTLLEATGSGRLELPNSNFDVGETTGPGKYSMNDDAHAELLELLAKANFAGVPRDVRDELLAFYSQPDVEYSTRKKPKEWAKLQAAVQQLKAATASETLAAGSDAPVPKP
jgi:hypothetical protein